MTEREKIIQKYEKYFDKCDSIPYKGLILNPFTVDKIRECNYACYCLNIDPMELDDISLMPLKRLGLIKTIFERIINNQIPLNKELASKYVLVIESFKVLMNELFPSSTISMIDPNNPQRKKVITISYTKDNAFNSVVLSEKDFEEMSEIILYQNGIDTSWKDLSPIMRQDAQIEIERRNASNKSEPITIEKTIDIVANEWHDYDKIYKLSVRKFYNIFDNIQNREHYNNMMSGMFDVKDLKHWMSGGYDRNRYKGIFKSVGNQLGNATVKQTK